MDAARSIQQHLSRRLSLAAAAGLSLAILIPAAFSFFNLALLSSFLTLCIISIIAMLPIFVASIVMARTIAKSAEQLSMPGSDNRIVTPEAEQINVGGQPNTAIELQSTNLQRAVSKINHALLHTKKEKLLFPLICQIAVEHGGMTMAWIGTLNKTSKALIAASAFGKGIDRSEWVSVPISGNESGKRSPAAIAWNEGRYVIANHYSDDIAPWGESPPAEDLRAAAFCPIMRDGKVYAVLATCSKVPFDQESVPLLQELAENISLALANFDRQAIRHQAEGALRESERQLRLIADEAPFPMQVHAEDGEILLVNRAWSRVTGYTLASIPTLMEWRCQACGDYPAQAILYIENLYRSTEKEGSESVIHCKDGTERVCYFTSALLGSLPDGRRSMITMALDVTEHKRAKRDLQLTQFSIDQAADPLFWITKNGRIHFVNEAACRTLEYRRNELLSMSIMDINPTNTPDIWSALWQQIHARKTMTHETSLSTKRGGLIQVESTSTFIEFEGEEYMCAFIRDITEKKKTEELVWRQANFDTLTGLPNRSMFLDRLDHEIRKANRSGLPLALMFIDLDHFKNVNDTLGHNMGDLLLKDVTARLRRCVRETDTVSRLGGDEFTVILGELHDVRSIERIARAIVQTLSEPFDIADESVYVSASVGITFYPEDATEIEDLLKNADQAMYAAKQEGRNRYHYFTPSMQEAAQARMKLIKDLRVALDGNQFEVRYQPIVELATGNVYKAEALLRWHHPTRGIISPVEFIPVTEETGLIHEIGDWVFWEAADQVATWREKYHPQFQISVNMSPVQFRENEKSSAAWIQYLQSLEIPWMSIVVEITEGLLLDANQGITDQLLAFHDAGMQVAIDDFGIGYSSLSYLKKFDIDYLKIDRSFVKSLAPGSHDMALCEAIIMMAHKLGIMVIAEGVETREQCNLLTEAGCDFAQGFLFSKPVPAAEFDVLYKKGFGIAELSSGNQCNLFESRAG